MRYVVLSFATALMVAGCGSGGGNISLDGGHQDLSGGGGLPDLTTGGTTSNIGGACAMKTDCVEGTTPICLTHLANNSMYASMPKGYCSSKCAMDTDCGTNGGVCNDYGTTAMPDQWCASSCGTAADCRGPDYVCDFLVFSVNTSNAQTCTPAAYYGCDPSTDTCTTARGAAGGCLHAALSAAPATSGFCIGTCVAGTGTCPAMGTAAAGQCVPVKVFTMKVSATDKLASVALCETKPTTPIADLAACTKSNDCNEGSGCSPTDKKCHKLCYSGTPPTPMAGTVAPACAAGTACMDDWGLFSSTDMKIGACR